VEEDVLGQGRGEGAGEGKSTRAEGDSNPPSQGMRPQDPDAVKAMEERIKNLDIAPQASAA